MAWPTDDPDFPDLPVLRAGVEPDPALTARVQAQALQAFEQAHRRNVAEAERVPWLLLALAPVAVAQLCLAFIRAIQIFTDS